MYPNAPPLPTRGFETQDNSQRSVHISFQDALPDGTYALSDQLAVMSYKEQSNYLEAKNIDGNIVINAFIGTYIGSFTADFSDKFGRVWSGVGDFAIEVIPNK
ncbi:hypothetical protein HCU66_20065 [Pseudomonas frederiksbergensis]|uniref:hypothetical protein n=1 Tax=Pseudomonas frederiksbergensis TaxID=104087 RepID=UPI0019802944|nr:hypothetical protein [Pseudomonas frederiksbergensis]MBN3864536.1 hypothetical protein [Pseudomonas frederiksbergensis]